MQKQHEVVGHGVIKSYSYMIDIKFTDGVNNYKCIPKSVNSKDNILFDVIKTSVPDQDIKTELLGLVRDVMHAEPFIFTYNASKKKFIGMKGNITYYAMVLFNKIIVIEKERYYSVIDKYLRNKLSKLSRNLYMLKLKMKGLL
jgi:hypothetical protein